MNIKIGEIFVKLKWSQAMHCKVQNRVNLTRIVCKQNSVEKLTLTLTCQFSDGWHFYLRSTFRLFIHYYHVHSMSQIS